MKKTKDSTPPLTPPQLAKRWGVSRRTILRDIVAGKIAATKLHDRCYLISMGEIERLEKKCEPS